ncbi:universal stress protein [Actinoplanes sp. KI2]|uniref:universal stress protein n=1 Tax=Actinoplanes sp. KI2 TaxID=2983315 RepID=UPI003982D72D
MCWPCARGSHQPSHGVPTPGNPCVPVQLRLTPGSPGAVLVHASQDAQLVVAGARGHGGFAGLQLGSASHQVLHHARCPC